MTDNERKELLLKAKSILFNTDMVRAILDGRKTVTRRVIKGIPENAHMFMGIGYETQKAEFLCGEVRNGCCFDFGVEVAMRYKVGDILYVREAWAQYHEHFLFKTNCSDADFILGQNGATIKWHPSIHMPKEAARIFLRVTDVRVERLQDITDDDCMAEGICSWTKDGKLYKYYLSDEDGDYPACKWSECPKTPQDAMQRIWDSTIKKSDLDRYGWDANPWVWVIEFERID